jgi:hypothetical protein
MEKLMKGKYIILISIFLIIVISIAGCVDKPQSRGPWYTFADLFKPGYYYDAGQKDIYNDLVDIEKILGHTSGFSDFDEANTLTKYLDRAFSAAWIESTLLNAGGACTRGRVSLSDTKEEVPLHEALKHFGDLYNDGDPNTNPSIDDLKATKELAECYLNTYSTKSSVDEYLFDVTNALIKFLDTKISSYESAEEQSGVSDDSGKIRKIDVEVQEQSEEIVTEKVAENVEIKVLGEGEFGYDDGEVDSQCSIGDDGQAVFFPNDEKLNIYGIRICGARSGDPTRMFDVEIWDSNFKTLYSASYDYSDYFPDTHPPRMDNSDLKWVTIDVPNIEVNGNFYIAIFTYSRFDSGIVIGRDSDTKSGNSFVVSKNPNRIEDWETTTTWDIRQEDTDWMIRAVTAQ